MKRFLSKLCLFLVIHLLVLAAILRFDGEPVSDNYLAGAWRKHQRLNEVPAPRILLLGGSNVPFGFQSPMIEEAFDLPVVNMGLVGGLGIEFMLREVTPSIGDGDVVVLSFEYDLWAGGSDESIQRQVLYFRPLGLRSLPLDRWAGFFDEEAFPVLFAWVRRAVGLEGFYPAGNRTGERLGFNAQGDFVGHWGKPSPSREEAAFSRGLVPEIDARVEARLRKFVALCVRSGARCVYTFPPHPQSVLQAHREALARLEQVLGAIPGLIVLDDPLDQAYAEELFFDTGYHLVREGSRQRTEKLIRGLEPFFEVP